MTYLLNCTNKHVAWIGGVFLGGIIGAIFQALLMTHHTILALIVFLIAYTFIPYIASLHQNWEGRQEDKKKAKNGK